MKDVKNKKSIVLVSIIIFALIVVVVGITYSAYYWASPNSGLAGTSECFAVNYVKGNDIGSDNEKATLNLAKDYTGGLSSTATVSIDDTCNITSGYATVYLTSDEVTTDLLIDIGILNYQVFANNYPACSGVITSKDKTVICDDIYVDTSENQIKVYVWLNGELATDDNYSEIASSTYKGYINLSVRGGE